MTKPIISLKNQRFGRLLVIDLDTEKMNELYRKKENGEIKNHNTFWVCKCDCGNIVSVSRSNLKSSITKSCGCYKTEQLHKTKNAKYNTWIFNDDIVEGYTFKGEKFIIDSDDYLKVKNYCWRKDAHGYIVANNKKDNNSIKIYRLIMNANKGDVIDHINQDKTNNRKSNLRFVTKSQNNTNIKRRKDNKSGYTGVKYDKRNLKWKAQISYNNKRIHLGTYDKIEDAINARRNAELKIHKEYSGEINRKDYDKFIKEAEEVDNE